MPNSEERLREAIIHVTRLVVDHGLSRSSDGNISIRLDENRILATPTGLYKKTMEPEDLVIVNNDGELVQAARGRQPTSELKLHLEVYRQRSDVRAVLHAHPPYSTALTIVGTPFPTDYLPEVLLALGEVPTAPYAHPGTQAVPLSIRDLIRKHNNILLSHHGSVSVGETLEETLIALERMEHAAYTYYLALGYGVPKALPQDELAALRKNGAEGY